MNEWERFYTAMAREVPEDARIMMCSFRGDPAEEFRGKWRARVLDDPRAVDRRANVYLSVSAMRRNARGEFRRRKENFAGGLCLMIDDLGDGPGSKWPLSVVDPLPPTALIETSPANFQAVYIFERAVEDREEFSALIRAFIAQRFLSDDPGMGGVNRVFRPPVGVNGKAKYGGAFPVTAHQLCEDHRYAIDEIVRAFGLRLSPVRPPVPRGATADRAQRIRAFIAVRSALRAAGMVKREEADLEGWVDVVCPWTAEHTGAADNGAAIREPAEENGWTGAFRCHHGGCAERGWRDLTEWLAGEAEQILEAVNRAAPPTIEEYEA